MGEVLRVLRVCVVYVYVCDPQIKGSLNND